ncbi:MAG TPA: DUF134 domain-containing protein [Candidatus Cloacimonadota bacterium]|nr:DUF134 domain-containing protein [Candidatus Cloacimonadota bacterium]HPT72399.1 DUF134 domain-containing protein [Candidatus Cloacimonadota bacterium]
MGRNCIRRHVEFTPEIREFKPCGRHGLKKHAIHLTLDEFEVIRLLDYLHLNQEDAASRMKISRPTLTRIYEKARIKIATILVEGRPFIIDGGDIEIMEGSNECPQCHSLVSLAAQGSLFCPRCKIHIEKDKIKEEMMKIAIPATEDGILCPHFGHAPMFAIVEVNSETKEIVSSTLYKPEMGGHAAVPPWLRMMGVTKLIAGGLGAMAVDNLQRNGIEVIAGAPELKVEDVTTLWLDGKLISNPKPCSHEHHEGCEHDHHHGHDQ